jgi:hypothetical protein
MLGKSEKVREKKKKPKQTFPELTFLSFANILDFSFTVFELHLSSFYYAG